MTSPVRPADRLRDALALALLAGGAGLFLYSYRAMRALAAGDFTVERGQWATDQWSRYRDLSYVGLALAVLGIAAAVWSYWRRAQRHDDPPA